MKKIHYLFLASAALLGVSCSNDVDTSFAENGKEKEVVLTLQLPSQLQTYAYGDGTTAERLYYAVYEHNENSDALNPVITGTVEEAFKDSYTYTQKFTVITGVTYDFVFFADSPQSPYKFEAETATFTDTSEATDGVYNGNNENRDAFYGVLTEKITDTFNLNVELKRPFAQLNLATSDLNESIVASKFGEKYEKLFISAETETYSSFNLLTKEVDNKKTVTFKAGIPSNETLKIEGEIYDVLSMNYLLLPVGLTYQNSIFTIYCDNETVREITTANLPVQPNFRTNVFGQLLTSNGEVTITIAPDFDGSFDNMIEVAPGLFYNENAKTYGVHSAEGLQSLGERTIGPKETVVLNSDIDMDGQVLPMITTSWHPESPNTFDGNGHTIKNAQLDGDSKNLIPSWVGPIRNLNIEDLTGNVDDRFTGLFGNVYGDIENIHLKNITITSSEGRVGAIVGIHNAGAMRNCSLEDSEFIGTWSVGGMIGCINETAKGRIYENLHIKNVKVTNTKRFGGVFDKMTGVLVGNINIAGVEFVDCTIEGCDTELPIYDTFNEYIWNGEIISPNIDEEGNPL